jgi:hypothetical protein
MNITRLPKRPARRQATDAPLQTLLRVLEANLHRTTEPELIARLRAALEKLQTKDDGGRA